MQIPPECIKDRKNDVNDTDKDDDTLIKKSHQKSVKNVKRRRGQKSANLPEKGGKNVKKCQIIKSSRKIQKCQKYY